MRNFVWTSVGLVLVGTMVVLSASINYSFGFSLGTTDASGRIYGAVSVGAVVAMALLPIRIAAHWHARRHLTAILGSAVFVLALSYAIAGSIGFGMLNRSQAVGAREALNQKLGEQFAERARLVRRRDSLDEQQPRAVIVAQILEAKRDRRWGQTTGCTTVTAISSRDYCQSVDRLNARLAAAEEAIDLSGQIARLDQSIDKLRSQGAGNLQDAQAAGLARMIASDEESVQLGLAILLALLLESLCCFGLLVIVGVRAEQFSDRVTAPEWIGRWLTERARPAEGGNVQLAELEQDFLIWRERSKAPTLSRWKFRRLLRAACREVGLLMHDKAVAGIELLER